MRIILTAGVIVTVLSACVAPTSTQTAVTASRAIPNDPFTTQINTLRARRGLAPVAPEARLNIAAQAHADDMAARGFFAHRGSDNSNAGERIERAGYFPCGWAENIGTGVATDAGAFAAWQASPAHLRNMTGANYTDYGLGNAGGKWVLIMARSC